MNTTSLSIQRQVRVPVVQPVSNTIDNSNYKKYSIIGYSSSSRSIVQLFQQQVRVSLLVLLLLFFFFNANNNNNNNNNNNGLLFVEGVIPQLGFDVVWTTRSNFITTSQPKATTTVTKRTFYASHAFFGTLPLPLAKQQQQQQQQQDDDNTNNSNHQLQIVFPPTNNPLLCNDIYNILESSDNDNINDIDNNSNKLQQYPNNSIVFIPRGVCSFETKAYIAQKLNAHAVIIYGTLGSRYSLKTNTTGSTTNNNNNNNNNNNKNNATMADIIWPIDRYDYDCTSGRSIIPSSSLSFDPLPYNSQLNDIVLLDGPLYNYDHGSIVGSTSTGIVRSSQVYTDPTITTTGECAYFSTGNNGLQYCQSQQCLLTGKTYNTTVLSSNIENYKQVAYKYEHISRANETIYYEACCAWDLHIWLYPDTNTNSNNNNNNNNNNQSTAVSNNQRGPITIPVAYITTKQFQEIQYVLNFHESIEQQIQSQQSGNNDYNNDFNYTSYSNPKIIFYTRYRPKYNISAILIWMLGSFVAVLASYLTASDYRQLIHNYSQSTTSTATINSTANTKTTTILSGSTNSNTTGTSTTIHNSPRNNSLSPNRRHQQRQRQQSNNADTINNSSNHSDHHQNTRIRTSSSSSSSSTIRTPPTSSTTSTIVESTPQSQNQNEQHQQSQQNQQQQEVLELTPYHAVGFVIMASTSLMTLFYFKIYGIVKVFYAIGCSTAVSQILLVPIIQRIMFELTIPNILLYDYIIDDIQTIISVRDIVSYSIGYITGCIWLYMALFVHDSESYTFFWIAQDIFGTCMCISFLQVIRLNSIRVASLLLIVAFLYDIFFVFITPLLFNGKSIMITVATSGGPPKADALFCEKYPYDIDCQGGTPMPMLFAIPKINDYIGGTSLLGLGDIVLPGLLLSFAARYDAAKALIGIQRGGRGTHRSMYTRNNNCSEQQSFCCFFSFLPKSTSSYICNNGYFIPICIAYAVGLGMANTAVYVMNMGQPALLYLVPTCLGTLIYIGYQRNELHDLWYGPKSLKIADNILYDTTTGSTSRSSSTTATQRSITDTEYSSLPLQEEENNEQEQQQTQQQSEAHDNRLLF